MNKKKVYDLEFNCNGNSDAGLSFSFKCPDCDEAVTVAEHEWWEPTCNCQDDKRLWRLNIFAETVFDV